MRDLSSKSGVDAAPEPEPIAGRTSIVLPMLIGLFLVWLSGSWVYRSELVSQAAQISNSIPAIPGIALLILVVLLRPLLRLFKWRLPTPRVIATYVLVIISVFMFSVGIVRYMLLSLVGIRYYSTGQDPIAQLATDLPDWVLPSSSLVAKHFFEGSPTGEVPWQGWIVPATAWGCFLLLFIGTLLALMLLFSERWIDHERLAFPLARLPVEVLGEGTIGSFFRNPLTWVGIAAATVLNGFNALRGAFRSGPRGMLRIRFDRGRGGADLFPAYPLKALKPLMAWVSPELIGLGYLVSTELSFSIWFFWVIQRLQSLGLALGGIRTAEAPYAYEQATGAYLALALILLYKDREVIFAAVRNWLGHREAESDTLRTRWALVASTLGILGCIAFLHRAGMDLWLAALYMAILALVAIVYGRVRAETGVAMVWILAVGQQDKVIVNFLGQGPILAGTTHRSAAAFGMTRWLANGYPSSVSGYHIEALKLGERTGLSWKQISTLTMVGVAWGIGLSIFAHLRTYYDVGSITQPTTLWASPEVKRTYVDLLSAMDAPLGPSRTRIGWTAFGAGVMWLLTLGRARWVGFPFHPIGYALANAYGNHYWFPFLIVWLVKTLLLRYGGARAFQRALPLFLGFALGHYVITGMVWGVLSAYLGPPFSRWPVWYG